MSDLIMQKPLISIVSPIYKAKSIIPKLVQEIIDSVRIITADFEIILVDDGCPQNSWEVIDIECEKEPRVKGIKLSRNFGQHAAISAGLSEAKGEWIVVMDCDLQDKPSNIPLFYDAAREGDYDLVVGRKTLRGDNVFRKIESYLFYKLLGKLSGVNISNGVGNFGIYKRKVINGLLDLKEEFRSFGVQIVWLGFKRFELEIKSDERLEGKSSYTLLSKWKLAINTITSFSSRVLSLIISLGFFVFFVAFVLLAINLVNVWVSESTVAGWTSIMLSIYLSLGIVISCIGIVGLYVGKIFSEVKKRPVYIVSEMKVKSH